MQPERVELAIGEKTFFIETGVLARQAAGATVVGLEESMVLATAACDDKPREGADFLPLTIDYRDKTASAGRIPGGFLKREARPSDRETLLSRLIDRSLRPMFAEGYAHETQIIVNPLSFDYENETEILALNGASASLLISQIPFTKAIGGVKVGRVDGEFVVFPTLEQIEESDLMLILAGTEESLTMVEGGGNEISEEDLVAALEFGHEYVKKICAMQRELADKVGKPKMAVPVADHGADVATILEKGKDAIRTASLTTGKFERSAAQKACRDEIIAGLLGDDDDDSRKSVLKEAYGTAQKKVIREMILSEGIRADGRKTNEIRDITIAVDALPRTHGSSLFTRGETQALVTTTLGASKDELIQDKLEGRVNRQFMLHYNFPPFCVGEVKRMMGVSRREIGHGALAERALEPVLPKNEDFPYTIRIVSEILESNGSSSMASVCGGSLSLMDAGVPIKSAVAGVAMGMVQDGDRVAILTDILGLEDALGDMDFKVAGTKDGITAVQMDIKLKGGLKVELLSAALTQAKEGRLSILDTMATALESHRTDLSEHAPRIETIKINSEKIGALIGPGGKVIKGIVAETGCQVDVNDEGVVRVFSSDRAKMEEALNIINAIVQEAEPGKIYVGTVRRIVDFGAFLEIFPGTDGLCHISELADYRVNKVEDELALGDEVLVKVLSIDPQGKIRLSRKEAQEGGSSRRQPPEGGEGAPRPGSEDGGRPRGGGRPGGPGGGRPGGGRPGGGRGPGGGDRDHRRR